MPEFNEARRQAVISLVGIGFTQKATAEILHCSPAVVGNDVKASGGAQAIAPAEKLHNFQVEGAAFRIYAECKTGLKDSPYLMQVLEEYLNIERERICFWNVFDAYSKLSEPDLTALRPAHRKLLEVCRGQPSQGPYEEDGWEKFLATWADGTVRMNTSLDKTNTITFIANYLKVREIVCRRVSPAIEKQIEEAVNSLPDLDRQIVRLLHGFDGDAIGREKIAAELDETYETVRRRYDNGIRRLRGIFHREGVYAELSPMSQAEPERRKTAELQQRISELGKVRNPQVE